MSLRVFSPISALLLLLVVNQAPSALATLSWESSGPGGGGALASPSMSKKGSIIVGADLGGAYRSTNGGALWSAIGTNHGLMSTHVDATAFHPTIDGILFLGTPNGIYKSTNCDTSPAGPCTFSRTAESGFTTAIAVADIGGSASTTVYAVQLQSWCQAGIQLLKSTDTGGSWVQMSASGLPPDVGIMAIRIQPGFPNNIVAISANSRYTTGCGPTSTFPNGAPNRAFLSTDGGASFTPLNIPTANTFNQQTENGITWAYIEDVKFDKKYKNKLWATVTTNPSVPGFWVYNGELWMSSGTAGLGNAFTLQSNSQTGQLWPLSTGDVRTIDLRRQLPWDPNRGVWQWSVSTSTWTRLTTDAQWATWTAAIGPSFNGNVQTILAYNDKIVLGATQGGFFGTTNGGILFRQYTTTVSGNPPTYLSTKLDNNVAAVIAPSPSDDYLYVGYFDLGLYSTTSASTANAPRWTNINSASFDGIWNGLGGWATGIAVDPFVKGVVWAVQSGIVGSAWAFYITKSTDHGVTWTNRTYNFDALSNSQPVSDLLVDATKPITRQLWAISNNLLFTLDDSASTWTQVQTPCDTGLIVFAKSGSNFVAGGVTGLCYSSDGGLTWAKSNLNGGNPFGPPSSENVWWAGLATVTDVAFDPSNANSVWLTVGTWYQSFITGLPGLYRSRDGGATWTFVSTFAPLPNGRTYTRTVAVSPINSNIIVVGTSQALNGGGYTIPNPGDSDHGAWVSRDGGNTWSLENSGLAWPFITRLRFTSGKKTRLYGVSPGQGLVFSKVSP